MMDIKKHLMQVFTLDKEILKLTEQLAELRARQQAPGGRYDGLGVQKTRNVTVQEDLSIKAMRTEEKIALAKVKLLQIETKIHASSRHLPPMQRAVITWRYICRFIWKDIAERAEMSEMQLMRVHNEALKTMEAHFKAA
ncbi:MAG: hypothetical protein FWC67_04710 [Defluviitaleaceae bacterium]|nr:hypothetical protein [Defluviitaleaceae bacterium]